MPYGNVRARASPLIANQAKPVDADFHGGDMKDLSHLLFWDWIFDFRDYKYEIQPRGY